MICGFSYFCLCLPVLLTPDAVIVPLLSFSPPSPRFSRRNGNYLGPGRKNTAKIVEGDNCVFVQAQCIHL